MRARDARQLFTVGSVKNSLERGKTLYEALRRRETLGDLHRDIKIYGKGEVMSIRKEDILGFDQAKIEITLENNREINIIARNEYITILSSDNETLVSAPYIINLIPSEGPPIQSHLLNEGDKVTLIITKPLAMILYEEKVRQWVEKWQQYFTQEKEKSTWPYPYEFKDFKF
ncbi:MAG TPA: DUF917 family protein, partial [Candidatus Aenigmarchaeota archaeon]|nr:DUF917 family protein [Candidatus Aenigmarchaeota archaeon]